MKSFLKLSLLLSLLISFSCQKEDDTDALSPCDTLVCLNGGVCVNGSCDCPEGYKGDFCEIIEVPQSVTIESIKLLNFLTRKPDGALWDDDGAPDIYLSYFNQNDLVLWSLTQAAMNVSPADDFVFTEINYVEDKYNQVRFIKLYDRDLDQNELVGEVAFTLNDAVLNRDSTLLVSNVDGTSLELRLSY